MNKKATAIGFVIALSIAILAIIIYTLYIGVTLDLSSQDITNKLKSISVLKKRASIGALSNLPVFFYLLYRKKEDYAKGVLIVIVLLALIFIINKL
ncbi:hypothetical protein [Lacinutrix sp.]|uniref:hypothetical protein n=1 Tax=Lacinutrix sp. TaxID=1937692 RepID=UPI0025C0FE64|nr:hypothetical protein [Lacinutrix sp.]